MHLHLLLQPEEGRAWAVVAMAVMVVLSWARAEQGFDSLDAGEEGRRCIQSSERLCCNCSLGRLDCRLGELVVVACSRIECGDRCRTECWN